MKLKINIERIIREKPYINKGFIKDEGSILPALKIEYLKRKDLKSIKNDNTKGKVKTKRYKDRNNFL